MYNILTLDGGGQLELTSTLMLEEIEMRRPGFLKKTDIIAGHLGRSDAWLDSRY
jgi:hypothetical protein